MIDERDELRAGDTCYVTDTQGRLRTVKVLSRKRKWLTTEGSLRFDTTNGYQGECTYGYTPTIRTIAQHNYSQALADLVHATNKLQQSIKRDTYLTSGLSLRKVQDMTKAIGELTAQLAG